MRLILAICALAISTAAYSMGPRYGEDFGDGNAQLWSSIDAHPWLVTSGYYYNRDLVGSVSSTVTLYDQATKWADNFAYTLRLYADFPAAANRVGVVFGYMSAGNYYEVLVNTPGQVTVTRFVSGSASWSATGTVAAFPADTFVPAEVVLASGKLSVRINGATTTFPNPAGGSPISNVTLPAVNNGQIGLVARSNMGRFDDISIVNLFFRTSFSGAQLGDPRASNGGESCTTTCWQDVTGVDSVFPDQQWPFHIYGMEGQFQLLADANPLSASTVGQYLHNEIQTVTGHAGSSTAALYQRIDQRGNDDGGATQDPLNFRWLGSAGSQPAQGDLYVRFWIKLQPEFPGNLVDGWRMFFQWKDGSDYRLSLNMITSANRTHDNIPVWNLVADNQATPQPKVTYFSFFRPATVPSEVPTGWFKFEFFQHRNPNNLNDFRVWVAINGVTRFDVSAPDDLETGNAQYTGDYTKIDRIMLPQLYWGTWREGDVDVPVYQWVDDVEVWDGFPPSASSHD